MPVPSFETIFVLSVGETNEEKMQNRQTRSY